MPDARCLKLRYRDRVSGSYYGEIDRKDNPSG